MVFVWETPLPVKIIESDDRPPNFLIILITDFDHDARHNPVAK
jgi:hypothetical protein